MAAFLADGAVRVAAAGGEVVGADDGGAALDPAPSADMVRRREVDDRAAVVIGGETGDAADLVEAALVQRQVDALPAGQLAAAALPDDAALLGSGRQALVRQGLHRGHVLEHRRPRVLGFVGPGSRHAFGRCDGRHDLARLHRVARLQRLEGGHPAVAGRRYGGLHLHRADDEQGLAGGDLFAVRRAHLEDRAGHRAGDGLLAGFDGEFRGAAFAAGCVPAPLATERPITVACCRKRVMAPLAVAMPGVGREQIGVLLQQRGPGIAGADGRVREDRLELVEVRGESADVELRNGAPHALHGGGVRHGAGDRTRRSSWPSPWRAADRTGAEASSRHSRSRRLGRRGPAGSLYALSVPAPRATTRAWTAKPRGSLTAVWSPRPRESRVAPAATWNCASTRSKPVTCSVTVCSTWMRALHSMKKCSPVSGTTRNSTVPAFT